ncbi:protein activator of alkane oxidation PraB [Brevundimonas diminuta]|uniref:protein activator of alkane oxidation PraB n=1 Tax=Brevundimonas diminuta TaxID=293 RepID=UPI003D9A53EC
MSPEPKAASIASAAVLAIAGFAAPAMAQSISPAGTSFVLSGALTLEQSTTINCNVSLNGTVAADGSSATITGGSFSPGDWQCGLLVSPSGFPWTITPNGGGSITITNIGASSILGSCNGVITTNWNNGTSSVYFPTSTIPGSPNPCKITGTLTSSPGLTIS